MQRALKDYRWEPTRTKAFTPTEVLYRLYREYIGSFTYRDPEVTELSKRQFGAALRRVYPFDEEGPDPYRVYRTVHGKRCWGYLGLVGPETIETSDERGRPTISDVLE